MKPRPFWEATNRSATEDFFQRLMKLESSLASSQDPITGPYPEPEEFSP
jgi:hypothetical protein